MSVAPTVTEAMVEARDWIAKQVAQLSELPHRYAEEIAGLKKVSAALEAALAASVPQADEVEAADRIGEWLSAALDDPKVGPAMKADINAWFEAGSPRPFLPASGAGAALNVDALAQEIRRVDGTNTLGAGALAEALMPFLRNLSSQPK